jgi:hypothetical protein
MTTTQTLVPVAASFMGTPVADGQQARTPRHARSRAARILRRCRVAIVTAVAALCMLVLISPAPAQAMTTQSWAMCTSWTGRPADGITVSFPRVTLGPGEAVWLIVYAYTADGRQYTSNWNYAVGDSDWMTPGPAELGGQWVPIAARDGSGAALSLPGAGLKFQAVVWLLPHTAGKDPIATGRWESHYAVNPATGTTGCAS